MLEMEWNLQYDNQRLTSWSIEKFKVVILIMMYVYDLINIKYGNIIQIYYKSKKQSNDHTAGLRIYHIVSMEQASN